MRQPLLELVKTFEGCKLTAYQNGGGIWTIGYGHTHAVRPGMTITAAAAETWLRADLESAALGVKSLVKVPLTAGQRDALIDFVFNLGVDRLKNSTLLKQLNAGHYEAVPAELRKWNRVAGHISVGLVRRRAADVALWESPEDPGKANAS